MNRLCLSVAALLVLAAAAPVHAQPVTVRGTLTGAGGQPMPAAHIVVQDGPADTTLVAAADEEGRFSLRVPELGGYVMYLLGVHHQTLGALPLILGEPGAVELNARLAARRPVTPLDSVRVSGTFAAFEQARRLLLMRHRADGSFARRVQPTADSLAYQVWVAAKSPSGTQERSLAGTHADRYAFNRQGPFWDEKSDYAAVLGGPRANGDSARIAFDPSALPSPGSEAVIQSSDATIESVARVYRDVEARRRHIGEKVRAIESGLDGPPSEAEKQALRDTLDAFVAELRRPVRERIETAEDPLVRNWLMLRIFDELRPPEGDSLLARRVLEEVPPTSPLWSFEAGSSVGVSNLLSQVARTAGQPRVADAYMKRVYENHPDRDVQVQALDVALTWARRRDDEDAFGRRYTRLVNEFPESRQASDARMAYAPDRAIQQGQPVPSFEVAALGDSSQTYSAESLAGQPYLLDFWATWCGPCVKELPTLRKAYEKYREEGFQILSLSLDRARGDIAPFREKEPMPWKHTFLENGFRSRVADTFEVVGIPKPILVGPDGTIRATGEDARGEALMNALARMMDNERNADR